MSSIFAKTIAKAISDYRYLLRRYLTQAKRMAKLSELNLKDSGLYENDVLLYKTAKRITQDIEKNMDIKESGYYSYSGIAHFCEYLKKFLAHYEIEGARVVHRAQRASRALVYVIQLFMKSEADLTEAVAKEFIQCNEVIAVNGSPEQHALYQNNLEKYTLRYPTFYDPLLKDFLSRIQVESPEEEVA